jgi:hypothetical protein
MYYKVAQYDTYVCYQLILMLQITGFTTPAPACMYDKVAVFVHF